MLYESLNLTAIHTVVTQKNIIMCRMGIRKRCFFKILYVQHGRKVLSSQVKLYRSQGKVFKEDDEETALYMCIKVYKCVHFLTCALF